MPRAQRDLTDLYVRVGARSIDAAHIWYRALRQVSRRVKIATPEREDLRHLLYGNKPHIYRVIYRVLEKQKEVDVLDIRHGARQEFKSDDLKVSA